MASSAAVVRADFAVLNLTDSTVSGNGALFGAGWRHHDSTRPSEP